MVIGCSDKLLISDYIAFTATSFHLGHSQRSVMLVVLPLENVLTSYWHHILLLPTRKKKMVSIVYLVNCLLMHQRGALIHQIVLLRHSSNGNIALKN